MRPVSSFLVSFASIVGIAGAFFVPAPAPGEFLFWSDRDLIYCGCSEVSFEVLTVDLCTLLRAGRSFVWAKPPALARR